MSKKNARVEANAHRLVFYEPRVSVQSKFGPKLSSSLQFLQKIEEDEYDMEYGEDFYIQPRKSLTGIYKEDLIEFQGEDE